MKEFDLHVTNIFNSPPWKWIQPPTQSGRRGVNTTPLKTPAAKVGLVSYAEMRCLTTLITAGQATKVDTALDIYTKQRQATKWISTKCYSPTPMWIIVLVYIKPLYSRQISKKKKKNFTRVIQDKIANTILSLSHQSVRKTQSTGLLYTKNADASTERRYLYLVVQTSFLLTKQHLGSQEWYFDYRFRGGNSTYTA